MDVITPIPLDQIDTSGRIRSPSPEQVASLKASILLVGLLNPITVIHTGDQSYKLIAGGNRLEACRAAGYMEVPANVVDMTAPEAVIAECDENLCGPNLSPSERAIFTARRKEAYEEIYPHTRHGTNQHERSGQLGHSSDEGDFLPDDQPRFTAQTASATGQSERVVRRDAERGGKVIPEALNLISGTKLDTGVYLDTLKNMPPNDQIQKVRRDLAQQRRTDSLPSSTKVPERSEKPPERKMPTYEEVRAALYALGDLTAQEFLRLCPPAKRAAMCAHLAKLAATFEAVCEEAVQ